MNQQTVFDKIVFPVLFVIFGISLFSFILASLYPFRMDLVGKPDPIKKSGSAGLMK